MNWGHYEWLFPENHSDEMIRGYQAMRQQTLDQYILNISPATKFITELLFGEILKEIEFTQDGCILYIKGTNGINDMNFREKTMERSFQTLVKKIPEGTKAVFYDEYGQVMKVVNNEP